MDDSRLFPFKAMISRLMLNRAPLLVQMSIADIEVLMSILLDVYAYVDTPDDAADSLMGLAKQFSDIIERHHPESEPYLAFIFGAAVFRRQSNE